MSSYAGQSIESPGLKSCTVSGVELLDTSLRTTSNVIIDHGHAMAIPWPQEGSSVPNVSLVTGRYLDLGLHTTRQIGVTTTHGDGPRVPVWVTLARRPHLCALLQTLLPSQRRLLDRPWLWLITRRPRQASGFLGRRLVGWLDFACGRVTGGTGETPRAAKYCMYCWMLKGHKCWLQYSRKHPCGALRQEHRSSWLGIYSASLERGAPASRRGAWFLSFWNSTHRVCSISLVTACHSPKG